MALAKIIILEGADGSGKSTLANWLNAKHGYEIVKTNAPRPDEDVFKAYTDSLMTAVHSGRPTVFDRLHTGERIYGPLLRREDRLGTQGAALMERLVAATGTALVICAPPWTALAVGWAGKDDLLKRESQLRIVDAAYLAEAKRLGLTPYDWTKGEELTTTTNMPLPAGVTGYPDADVLWVGERVNQNKLAWDIAFHDCIGCSEYLWRALDAAGWTERRGAWVNAVTIDGAACDLLRAMESLPRLRRVVALGSMAMEACREVGVKSTSVPHPAFWSRFHAGETGAYQELLRKAIL